MASDVTIWERSKSVMDVICEQLSTGMLLGEILSQPGMPQRHTIDQWRARFPQFDEAMHRAQQQCMDALVEQCVKIADDSSRDWGVDADTGQLRPTDSPARAALRIKARQWLAERVGRARYGNHATLALTAEAGYNTAKREDVQARIAEVLARVRRRAGITDTGAEHGGSGSGAVVTGEGVDP